MNCYLKKLIFLVAISISAYGCFDDKYDFDKLDKTAELKLPPIPFGQLDTIWLAELTEAPISPGSTGETLLIEDFRGFFGEESISRFFYEGAAQVELNGKLDLYLQDPPAEFKLKISTLVIDANGEENPDIKIPDMHLVYGNDQNFRIILSPEYMQHMKHADGIRFMLDFQSSDEISFSDKDFVFIHDLIMTSGGMHFNF